MICDKTVGLATNVFSKVLASTMKNNSSIQLDFLFYKIFAQFGNPKNLDLCFRGLIAVQYLLQSESSVYIRDVCRRWISNINQYIPQQLPSLVRRKNIENIRSRYHKHLQDALQQDAVTGWLLYASFYYVIGQYNVTIRIVDHVLSKCTPDKTPSVERFVLAVEEKFFISPEQLSLSLTICGVCTELSGDIETACQCYDKAFVATIIFVSQQKSGKQGS
ncbi:Hypothetical predicted protein [Mytilus galloprovincialis]|uniref:Uncharacterized protein n=1 Tax=Mytilus galloprovincialis TaxID=29158 RepID=A0A8B6HJG0_MYTGA|nr:Hypothetical predicted protein [Mytilus galloprovincialis]